MIMILLGSMKKIDSTNTIYFSSLISNIIGLYVQFPKKDGVTTASTDTQTSLQETLFSQPPVLTRSTPRAVPILKRKKRRRSSSYSYTPSSSS
jgi:hypothetical protein